MRSLAMHYGYKIWLLSVNSRNTRVLPFRESLSKTYHNDRLNRKKYTNFHRNQSCQGLGGWEKGLMTKEPLGIFQGDGKVPYLEKLNKVYLHILYVLYLGNIMSRRIWKGARWLKLGWWFKSTYTLTRLLSQKVAQLQPAAAQRSPQGSRFFASLFSVAWVLGSLKEVPSLSHDGARARQPTCFLFLPK